MTSEHEKAGALEGPGGGIPPLHSSALSRWLESHPELVTRFFQVQSFPRETRIFRSQEALSGALPRLAIILSGELALTQLSPGVLAPHRALYRGDLWVNPNRTGSKRSGPTSAIHLMSVSASQVLLLTEQGLGSLPEQEARELEQILDDSTALLHARRAFFLAIRKTLQLRKAAVRHLHALLDTVEVRSYEEGGNGGEIIIQQGSTEEANKGIFLVLEGQLGEWRDPQGAETEPVLIRPLYTGSIFGDVVLHSDRPHPTTVKLHTGKARVAFLPQKSSEQLIHRSPLFAHAVSPAPSDSWQRIADGGTLLAHPPEVVLFRSDASDAPLELLIQAVAEATHQSHRDRILRVELVPSSQVGTPELPPEPRPGEVPLYRLRAHDGHAAALALQELARSLRGKWDHLFVHVDPRLWLGLVPPPGSALGFRPFLGGEVAWKLVELSRDPLAVPPPPGFDHGSILYAALLAPHTERLQGPAFPSGTVRLALNFRNFSSRRTFAQCSPAEQASFQRWGRAITERMVGVALGAGGSWGYAEIALIRGMQQRKIPIDVVSGTSFGALAGAFYSALGDSGLELLLKEGAKFNAVVLASIINSSAITRFIDRLLGHRRLEKTELPFFPVGTNVSKSQAWVVQQGTLGAGVRASGIMPGLLSPDYADDNSRVVDGAFINCVPASVLMSHRANLIVGTNVLSDPPDEEERGPLLPGPLGWFLHGLNPVGRISDAVRATLILFHTSGEQSVSHADVTFDSPFCPLPPWAFAQGQAIVDRAASVL
ncbi:cyclic nucleotide-binding and patatin-like phospholipase domain-containing protein, partial [Hyalangium sp.]|uniref:cyclic nucleotide-binding and patatin-like phospholipase domain-containing protein n=1 Tax=Hyalangium sp. TaxID=2028555 RepID=UPI002D386E22